MKKRIVNQFSCRGPTRPYWQTLRLLPFLDVRRFLNLGWTPWYLPFFVGSSQRRLALKVGKEIQQRLTKHGAVRLLDVGCGRGGPTIIFSMEFNFRTTGIDLVPHNVKAARAETRNNSRLNFLVADARSLPFQNRSFEAACGIDSVPYFVDLATSFGEIRRVLRPQGLWVFSTIVQRGGLIAEEHKKVSHFAELWDFAPLQTRDSYIDILGGEGFRIEKIEDLTLGSIGRYVKWTWLYLFVQKTFLKSVINWSLNRKDIDPLTLNNLIEDTYQALDYLRHLLFVVRKA